MKQVLPSNIKRFIVRLLAQGDAPSEVVRAVAQEFSVDVSAPAVLRYNPDLGQGEKLSAHLKELFYATRKAFIENADNLPMAQKGIRLKRLETIHDRAMEAGTLKIAATAIDLSRKEMMALELGQAGEFAGVFRVINSPDDDLPAAPSAAPATVPTLENPASVQVSEAQVGDSP
jgi:hypothetical protein